jgi:hypothetical protein
MYSIYCSCWRNKDKILLSYFLSFQRKVKYYYYSSQINHVNTDRPVTKSFLWENKYDAMHIAFSASKKSGEDTACTITCECAPQCIQFVQPSATLLPSATSCCDIKIIPMTQYHSELILLIARTFH